MDTVTFRIAQYMALLRCAAAAKDMRTVEKWRRKTDCHALEVIAEAQRRLDNALAALEKETK